MSRAVRRSSAPQTSSAQESDSPTSALQEPPLHVREASTAIIASMTIVTTEPDLLVAAGDRGPGDPPSRRRRFAAVALDLLAALVALFAGCTVAIGWLLVRTAWGRDDVASGDARVAVALILATTPAWAAWE